ncbi:phage antirepressor KilAC domain-containing protein [Nocardia farcinica]|uniref:phage antirepressor KilAC domain-containing protein n=1 Tax=Nocardia farcinica TaxID=37329 RepID=UPI001E527DF9|nr:phage antirepressor KilAC domain-containing protein [Nocardia farcinica]
MNDSTNYPTPVDLTTPHARSRRDALAARVDVLDKVGVLRALPDDMHVTTDMVAAFYGVPKETIRTLVRNNRDEIEGDGYRVVTRSVFEESFETKLPSSASSIALFPRRAVLRVGMLLRDSPIARRVRDMLLDVEAQSRPAELSEDEIVLRALEIQQGKIRALTAENQALTEKVAEDAPKVNYVELYVADSDLLKFRTVAAANDVGEDWLRDLLLEKNWIYVETERRWSNTKGCMEIRRRYSAYSHKRQYFRPVEVHEAPRFKGEVMHTLKITPAGAEAVARLIERERAA